MNKSFQATYKKVAPKKVTTQNIIIMALLLSLFVINGCARSRSRAPSANFRAINHTQYAIPLYSVNGRESSISKLEGQGGSIPLPAWWDIRSKTAEIKWVMEPSSEEAFEVLPPFGSPGYAEVFKQHAAKHRYYRTTVALPRFEPYGDYAYAFCKYNLHFLPCQQVKLIFSCKSYGNSGYPVTEPLNMPEPEVCPVSTSNPVERLESYTSSSDTSDSSDMRYSHYSTDKNNLTQKWLVRSMTTAYIPDENGRPIGGRIDPWGQKGSTDNIYATWVPEKWYPGLKAHVEWTIDPNPDANKRVGDSYHDEQVYAKQFRNEAAYRQHAANYQHYSATVDVIDYGIRHCGLTVHFLPCNQVKVTGTCWGYKHHNNPIKDPPNMPEPETCPTSTPPSAKK